jgi:hypothetical protein
VCSVMSMEDKFVTVLLHYVVKLGYRLSALHFWGEKETDLLSFMRKGSLSLHFFSLFFLWMLDFLSFLDIVKKSRMQNEEFKFSSYSVS